MIQYKTLPFGAPQRWHVIDLAQGIDARASVADYATETEARAHSDRLNAPLNHTTDTDTDTACWTLAYEAAGSDDAAWTLRYGTETDTTIYDVNATLRDTDTLAARSWATMTLAQNQDTTATGWTPHRPGPGTAPDYWSAVTD
ncbi:hypothetical protein [Streptomyces sp. NPDC088752]|uniref:hypothetical protein n=1 Tax=Streptomyces sp. NPDC088752 TaxID=3154963 RepID=UPI0034243F4B